MPYTILGQASPISEEPRNLDNRLYVPLSDVVERLGGQTSWDNTNKVATVQIGQWTAKVQIANRHVDVSGKAVSLSADPIVEQDTMYVPVTFFHDAFGYIVQADPRSGQVGISLPTQT